MRPGPHKWPTGQIHRRVYSSICNLRAGQGWPDQKHRSFFPNICCFDGVNGWGLNKLLCWAALRLQAMTRQIGSSDSNPRESSTRSVAKRSRLVSVPHMVNHKIWINNLSNIFRGQKQNYKPSMHSIIELGFWMFPPNNHPLWIYQKKRLMSPQMHATSLDGVFIRSRSMRFMAMTMHFEPPNVYLASSPVMPSGTWIPLAHEGWNGLYCSHLCQKLRTKLGSIRKRPSSASQCSSSWGRITGTCMVVFCFGLSRFLHGISTINGSLYANQPIKMRKPMDSYFSQTL